MHEHHLNLF